MNYSGHPAPESMLIFILDVRPVHSMTPIIPRFIGRSCEPFNNTSGAESQILHKKSAEHHLHPCTSSTQARNSHKPLRIVFLSAYNPPGHSLTIVGLEERKSGSCNLLVFDPMFKPSPAIQRLIGNQIRATAPEKLLKAYRRGDSYLRRHKCFEILK